jgi:hypothetical protein
MKLDNLAALMGDWGRYDKARKYFRESLEMRRRVLARSILPSRGRSTTTRGC